MFEQDTVWYDLIVGRHTLRQMGIKVDCEEDIMTWDDGVIAMRPFSSYSGMNEVTQLETILYNDLEQLLKRIPLHQRIRKFFCLSMTLMT